MVRRIKTATYALIFISICSTDAFMKTVGFNQNDCGKYRHYLYGADDSYEVEWNGNRYPKHCSLRFKMQTIDTYRVCADVTEFKLDCGLSVKFYWGVQMNKRTYDCNAAVPIKYCNEDLVFIQLEPNYQGIRDSKSTLRIKVTASLVSKYGSDSNSSSTAVIVGSVLGVVGTILFVVCGVCCCVKRPSMAETLRARTHQPIQGNFILLPSSDGRRDNLNPNSAGRSSPYIGRQSPVQGSDVIGSNSPQEFTTYPNEPGYTGNPHPSAPPLDSNAGYLGQQTYSGHSSQHTNDHSAPPPSYNEVINKAENYHVK